MDIKHINSIDPNSLELLEAAGYGDVQALAGANPQAVAAELAKANKLLHVAPQNIPASSIQQWIFQAQALLAPPAEAEPDTPPVATDDRPSVNYEDSPEVMQMLAASPFALPLPAKVLMEYHVSVNEIPVGIMLNNYIGDLDVRVSDTPVPALPAKPSTPLPPVGAVGTLPFKKQPEGRHDIVRSAKPSTNKGLDPESRWYVRGVLHTDPVTLHFGALVSLLTFLLIPLSLVAALLLVLSREMPEVFPWVSPWLLVVPGSLLIVGPSYLIWGLAGRCRICNQRLFTHRAQHKNSKAHHVPVLGYVLPLCLHILIFKWFRCSNCGTAIRIKE